MNDRDMSGERADIKLLADVDWIANKPEAHGGTTNEKGWSSGVTKVTERLEKAGVTSYPEVTKDLHEVIYGKRTEESLKSVGEAFDRLEKNHFDMKVINEMRQEWLDKKKRQERRGPKSESEQSEKSLVVREDTRAAVKIPPEMSMREYLKARAQGEGRRGGAEEPNFSESEEDGGAIEGDYRVVNDKAEAAPAVGFENDALRRAATAAKRLGNTKLFERVLENLVAANTDLSDADLDRAAALLRMGEPIPVVGAKTKGQEEAAASQNPNRERLKTDTSLRQFMRERAIEAVRLAAAESDLTLKAILGKIVMDLGFDPKTYVPVSLYDQLQSPDGKLITKEEKEVIRKEVEAEIEARCNLRLAQFKEKSFQEMKFGENTTAYADELEKGRFVDLQVSNDTLKWIREILPVTNEEAKAGGDQSEHALSCEGVDRAFQMLNLFGKTVEEYRDGLKESKELRKLEKKKFDESGKVSNDEQIKELERIEGEMGEIRVGLRKRMLGEVGIKYGIPEVYLELLESAMTERSFYDSSALERRDDLMERLKKDYGEDTENLAWQLFQGLRCEGLYFSGHYLGVLSLLDQSRNFLALNFDSWVGSKHGQIVVFKEGKLVDSEGLEFPVDKYGDLALEKRNVIYEKGVLRLKYPKEAARAMPEGHVIPIRNAFVEADVFGQQLRTLTTCPLNQVLKSGRADYFEDALAGNFLRNSNKGGRGEKTIEGQNSVQVNLGCEFRELLKKTRDLGTSEDKASQIGTAIGILLDIKKTGLKLADKGVITIAELEVTLKRERDNVLWELGVNNIFNTRGTQSVTKPQFLTPAGYNRLFEQFLIIPATGRPLVETNEDLGILRDRVLELREESLQAIRDMASESDEDQNELKKQREQVDNVILPGNLGEKLKTMHELSQLRGKAIGTRVGSTIADVLTFWLPRRKH